MLEYKFFLLRDSYQNDVELIKLRGSKQLIKINVTDIIEYDLHYFSTYLLIKNLNEKWSSYLKKEKKYIISLLF
jgi:hypothetical protein